MEAFRCRSEVDLCDGERRQDINVECSGVLGVVDDLSGVQGL